MSRNPFFKVSAAAIMHACIIGSAAAADGKKDAAGIFQVPEKIEYLLEDDCWKCHDYGTQKGDIRLDDLAGLENPKRLDLLNRMQEQVHFGHMPPKKEEQPSEADRKQILNFISTELAKHDASTLEGKLQKPEYGNYIDHGKLFSGEYLPAVMEIIAMEEAHAATIASRNAFLESHIERLCEEIYGDRNKAMLPTFVPVVLQPMPELKEGEKFKKAGINVSTGMLEKLGAAPLVYHTLTDPKFAKMSDDEFRSYCERVWFFRGDHERTIQGRMALLREFVPDFRRVAEGQIKRHKKTEYKPLAEEEMTAIRAAIQKHRKKGGRYNTLIEACIANWQQSFAQQRKDAGPPSPETLTALASQLSMLILEREPTAGETAEYVALTQSYIEKLGRRKAVQKLIQTFLLSSEFAYRSELGAGEPDEHGRRMMSPRDASYAIAYALTDQSPDAELVAAAGSDRLNTREDYKREVELILAKRNVRSLIDPVLEDKSWAENTTDMPIRELRFSASSSAIPKPWRFSRTRTGKTSVTRNWPNTRISCARTRCATSTRTTSNPETARAMV